MPAEFTMKRRVQFAETDLAGVMHFSNYFRWMEEVEHAFWRSKGHSIVHNDADVGAVGSISWPRVSVQCDYAAPARFEDELELRFRFVEAGDRSVKFEVEFLRDNQRVALAKATAVCCRMQGGRFSSIAIPASLRAVVEEGLTKSA